MGVDISHIIKHDFRKVHDREASMRFVKETIETLKKEDQYQNLISRQ